MSGERPAKATKASAIWPAVAAVVGLLGSMLVVPVVASAPAAAVGAVPDPPTAVTARAGDGQAKVSWTAPLFTDGQTVTGYTVTSSPGSLQCTTSGSPAATICTVTGLTNATAYTFSVTATTANGTSSASTASSSVTPLAGTTGVNFIGTYGTVKWNSGYVGADGYTNPASYAWPGSVYNSGGAAVNSTWTASSVNASYSSYCNGSWIWYQILCDPGAGANSPTTVYQISTSTGITYNTGNQPLVRAWVVVDLGAVRSFTTLRIFQMYSDGKVTDARMSVSSQVGATFPTYDDGSWTVVQSRSEIAAGGRTAVSAPRYLTCPTILDFGAQSGRYVLLEFWNAGQFLNPSWIEVGAAKLFFENEPASPGSGCSPSAPTDVTAIGGNGTAQVSWTAAVSADPLTAHALQYSSNGGSTWTTATTSPTPVGGSATSTTVTGLSNGASYIFRVSATNSSGTSPYSTPSNSVTPAGVPNPPTSVTAAAGDSSATVSWTAPASGPAPTGYTVTSSPDSKTCTTASSSCVVTGLRNTVSYTFAVVATNASGSSLPATTSAVTPVSALSPSTANFGTWPIPSGLSDPITFTYTNRTASSVTINPAGIYLLGTGTSSFKFRPGTTCAAEATIAAGGTCAIVLAFDPGSQGLKEAVLWLQRSDGDSTAALTGTGSLGVQTVTWEPMTTVNASMTPIPSSAATTDGDGAITYSVTSAGATGCTVDGSTGALSFSGTGECTVQAAAAATTQYAAGAVSVTFTIERASQSIQLVPSSSQNVFEGATVALSASGYSGGGAITYTVASGGSYCSISGSTLTADAAGTCTVTASIAQDSLYSAATSSAVTFTVTSRMQQVEWTPANTSVAVTASPLTPDAVATTTGDGAITYAVTSAGATGCVVDSTTGILTFSAAGSCVVRATAAATSTYVTGSTDVTFTVAAVVPGRPFITGASGGDAQATVTFTAPAFSGGAPVTSYTVTGSPSGSATCAASGSPMSCTVTGLTNGTSYTFTVVAVNSAGGGGASSASPAVTPVTAPTAPAALSLYAGNGTIDLAWSPPSCLTGAACGTFVDWTVDYRAAGGGVWTTAMTILTEGTTTYQITGLDNGLAYEVRVSLTTSLGSASTVGSEVPATTPTAPQAVAVAKTGATEVVLSWSAPASNGGTVVTTYEVIAGSESFTGCTSSPCTITGLTSGATYTFTVAARNRMGLGSAASATPVTMGAVAQTITVVPGATSGPVFGEIGLSTSGSTGSGARTFEITAGSGTVCSLSGSILTALATGTCTVQASIAADSLYSAAASAPVDITIVKANQSVLWAPTTSFVTTDTPVALAAATTSPSSAGVLSYSVVDAGTTHCSFTSGRTLAFTAAGDCVVRATATSTADYEADSTDVTITIALATRTVYWSPTASLTADDLGDALAPEPSVSSGAASYTYSIDDSGTAGCSVGASTALLSFVSTGTCDVRVTAAASSTYASASTSATITVTAASQAISVISSAASMVVADTVTLSAGGYSGTGTISYGINAADSAVCSLSGNVVTGLSAGSCRVTSAITADPLYSSATSLVGTIAVAEGPQTVTWAPTTSLLTTQSPFAPSPYALSSGTGAITYAVASAGATGCAIDSVTGLLTFSAPGRCRVTATAAAVTDVWLEGSADVTFIISAPVPVPAAGSDTSSVSSVPVDRDTLDPVPANAGLRPGQEMVTVAGVPVPVSVAALPANNGIDISGRGWGVALSGQQVDGRPVPLGAAGALVLTPGNALLIHGSGFEPYGQIRLYLLSQPVVLAAMEADSHGAFADVIVVPKGLPVGSHTIQVNGYTPDGLVRSVNYGVDVTVAAAETSVVGTRIYFGYRSAALTRDARMALAALARQVAPSSAAATVVVAVVRKKGATAADWALARARATNVARYLVKVGLAGSVTAHARRTAVQNVKQARRVNVTTAMQT